MFCENCGSKVDDRVRFCTYCGQTLPVETAPEPAPPVRKRESRSKSQTSFIDKMWENKSIKQGLLIAGCAIAAIAVLVFLFCFASADAPDVLLG